MLIVEKIKEKEMIQRLAKNFLIYAAIMGLLHFLSMAICFVIGFFMSNLAVFGIILMVSLIAILNSGYIYILCKKSSEKAFEGVSPVNATRKSKKRILFTPSVIIALVIIAVTAINMIIVHSEFIDAISSSTYYIYDDVTNINNIRLNSIKEYGPFSSLRVVESGIYCINVKDYPLDFLVTCGVIAVVNITIFVLAVFYEDKFLKKYLIIEEN